MEAIHSLRSPAWLNKVAAKGLVFCCLILAVHFLFLQNAFASSYSWPEINTYWQLGAENKYTAGSVSGDVKSNPTGGDCTSVSVAGWECTFSVDKQPSIPCGGNIPFRFTIPDTLSEGPHTALMSFNARGCDQEHYYAGTPIEFFVDKRLLQFQ